MSMVQQTVNGLVVRVSDTKAYMDYNANFALDYVEPVPAFPAGATDRTYVQGVRHAITDTVTIIAGGPMPWTDGDRYIANIDMALANQAARRAAEPPTPPYVPSSMEAQSAQRNTQAGPDYGGSGPLG